MSRQFISDLNSIFVKIEQEPPEFLHSPKHHELFITCNELILDDNGLYASEFEPCFFDPESPDINQHPPIFYEEYPSHHHQENFHKLLNLHMKDHLEWHQCAYMLCYEMVWAFDNYPRKGTKEDTRDLRSLTNWHPPRLCKEIHKYPFPFVFLGPIAAYIDTEDRRHVMFTMRHDAETPMGEELLRGETLAIAAVIITRLDRFRSEGHAYVPVLVFSFFGNLHGRILQAYFDGVTIVIWKTKMYHFTAENANSLVEIFMQQMSSAPTGDTKTVESQAAQQKASP